VATKKTRKRPGASKSSAPGGNAGELIKQYVADKVAEQVQAHAEKHSEQLNRLGPVAYDALDLWTRMEPGSRRPRFTREEIAAAAVRIADTEGIDALSMRRLAAELEAGTMTLYHYVRTKEELLALVTDTVMAELLLPPDELPSDWRAAITAIARSSCAVLTRHPWVFDIVENQSVGPNGLRHFDQSLQAVASFPGALADKLDVIYAVDEYVFGYCINARHGHAVDDDPLADAAMMNYVAELSSGGGYPELSALIAEHGLEPLWSEVAEYQRDPTRFDRNLERLLDGIAAHLDE
jgi:AcrR family transcriptional regulator